MRLLVSHRNSLRDTSPNRANSLTRILSRVQLCGTSRLAQVMMEAGAGVNDVFTYRWWHPNTYARAPDLPSTSFSTLFVSLPKSRRKRTKTREPRQQTSTYTYTIYTTKQSPPRAPRSSPVSRCSWLKLGEKKVTRSVTFRQS